LSVPFAQRNTQTLARASPLLYISELFEPHLASWVLDYGQSNGRYSILAASQFVPFLSFHYIPDSSFVYAVLSRALPAPCSPPRSSTPSHLFQSSVSFPTSRSSLPSLPKVSPPVTFVAAIKFLPEASTTSTNYIASQMHQSKRYQPCKTEAHDQNLNSNPTNIAPQSASGFVSQQAESDRTSCNEIHVAVTTISTNVEAAAVCDQQHS
jgi:hypothetical protein